MKEGKTGRNGMGRKEEQGWEQAVLATHLPAGAGAETPIRAILQCLWRGDTPLLVAGVMLMVGAGVCAQQ